MVDLVSYRQIYLDPLFRLLNFADTAVFYLLLLVPFVWIGFSYRWGIRLAYALMINLLINSTFKKLIGWPRPCTDLPELGFFHFTSYGFPSGGAQISLFLGGLFIYYCKPRSAWPFGLCYLLLLSFSRLYIGAHYPLDVLGGWMIGLLLLYFFVKTIDPLEKFFIEKGFMYSLLISEAIPLVLFPLVKRAAIVPLDAMIMGIGIFLSLKYGLYLKAPKHVGNGIIRGVFAATSSAFIYFILQGYPHDFAFAAVFCWISLLVSPCYRFLLRHQT